MCLDRQTADRTSRVSGRTTPPPPFNGPPNWLTRRLSRTRNWLRCRRPRCDCLAEPTTPPSAMGSMGFLAVLADVEKNVSRDGATGNYSSVWMVDRVFENRTSLITDPPDGRLPPMTPDAEQRQAVAREQRIANRYLGPEDLSLQVRCITYGIPRVSGLGAGYNSYYQIFQTSDHIVMLGEMIHDARVIPVADSLHIDDDIRQWHGDSRAHWEGDTLVVETTNFDPRAVYVGSTDGRHLIERLTRVGPDSLHYEITLTDPTVWTSSWTAMVPLGRTDDPIFEYACHEGNIGMAGILAGARVQEITPTDGASR